MTENSREKLIKSILISVIGIVCICLLLTFADGEKIPNWNTIGSCFSKEEVPDEDFIAFIDVGQGDSILICSGGYSALIDFGTPDSDDHNLVKAIRSYGVDKLDCVIATHYDSDHIGGGPEVLDAFDVDNAVIPEFEDRDTDVYDNFQLALIESGANVHTAKVGTVINIGEFELTVIGYYPSEEDSNDQSIVIMADIDGIKFLMAGDAGEAIEENLIEDRINLDCDVFKASHHGSRNSNSQDFVEAMSPEYAVISAGKGNSYGHPHDEVLDILENEGADIYRTDRSGNITFYVEDGKITVDTEY